MWEHTYCTILHSLLRIYCTLFCSITDGWRVYTTAIWIMLCLEKAPWRILIMFSQNIINSFRCTWKQTSIARNTATQWYTRAHWRQIANTGHFSSCNRQLDYPVLFWPPSYFKWRTQKTGEGRTKATRRKHNIVYFKIWSICFTLKPLRIPTALRSQSGNSPTLSSCMRSLFLDILWNRIYSISVAFLLSFSYLLILILSSTFQGIFKLIQLFSCWLLFSYNKKTVIIIKK